MNRLLFILNPNAGQRRVNRFLAEIVRLFIEHDYRVEVYVTGAQGDATRYLAQSRARYDMVVCAGGDGTLNETISGMLASRMKATLGYIPCGTTNDYASSLGLSQDVLRAARDIVEGRTQTVDVGSFNGRYFVYTATCGAFARASYSTSQTAKNVLGHLAYVLEGMRDLTAIRPIHMRVRTENTFIEDDFLFCSVTNSTSIGGILKLDAQLVALNDGLFEVTLVRNPTNPAQLSTILMGVTTQSLPNEMIHLFKARKINIETDPGVEWTLDGEREDETTSVKMVNMHSVVRIMIPRNGQTAPFDPAEEEAEL